MDFSIESGHLPSPSFENVRQFIRRLPECVSRNVCVYCFDTVGESWPMNSRATASDTPADLSRVVAV